MQTLKAIIVCSPAALRESFDRLKGKMTLLRHLAALRPGPVTSTVASAKTRLRAIARRWLALDAEIKEHDAHLETLTAAQAPELFAAHGMATGTAAEMLLVVGDNPERIHSEAAFAKLCGTCPIPASSGGPWRSLEAVEFATLEWVEWFNNRRLLEPIGNVPPAEAEARYYAELEALPKAA